MTSRAGWASARSRVSAGCLVALVLGTFGPVSRAVSMESRRRVDVTVPISHLNFGPDTHVRRGAHGGVPHDDGERIVFITVEERYIVRRTNTAGGTRLAVDEFPSVTLGAWRCRDMRCEGPTFRGVGAFTVGVGSWEFSGTLYDDGGEPCTVDAIWYPGPATGFPLHPVGARGSMHTTCFGDAAWTARQGAVYAAVEA